MSTRSDTLALGIKLSRARTAEALQVGLQEVMEHLGASCCSLLYFDSIAHGRPILEASQFPTLLRAEYHDLVSACRDPVMQHLRLRSSPMSWGVSTYVDVHQRDKWIRYADHGVASGTSIALHLSPARHFVFGIGWPDAWPSSDLTLQRLTQVQTLAVFAEPAAYVLATVGDLGPWEEPLSPRELGCLRLASRGLTDQVTASVLGVSQRTVHTHIAEAIRKLRASNRVQAAVIASAAGLFDVTSDI